MSNGSEGPNNGIRSTVVMFKGYKCFIYDYCKFVYLVANRKTSRSSVGSINVYV